MALDERARHELYLRLGEHPGPDAATTLMEHLPPTGWADVATKRDFDQLRAMTKADLDHHAELTRVEIARSGDEIRVELHKALAEQTRTVVLTAAIANVGAVLAAAGLAFTAARLS